MSSNSKAGMAIGIIALLVAISAFAYVISALGGVTDQIRSEISEVEGKLTAKSAADSQQLAQRLNSIETEQTALRQLTEKQLGDISGALKQAQEKLQAEEASRRALEQELAQRKAFEELLSKARQEGRLVIYTNTNLEVFTPWTDRFRAAYPFITVDVVRLPGAQLKARILAEHDAGKTGHDVVYISFRDLYDMGTQRAGIYRQYSSPQAVNFPETAKSASLDPSMKDLFIGVSSDVQGFAVNPATLQKAGLPVPGSVNEMVDPKYAGRFVMVSRLDTLTNIYRGLSTLNGEAFAREWFQKLAQLQPGLEASTSRIGSLVEAGEYAIGGYTTLDNVLARAELGASVKALPYVVGVSYDGAALLEKSPHPNAGRLFYEWLLSDEFVDSLLKVQRNPAKIGAPIGQGMNEILPSRFVYSVDVKFVYSEASATVQKWIAETLNIPTL